MSELAKALTKARAALRGTVFKGGTNTHNKYPYVGHEHVMTSGAREALQENDLSLVQTGVEFVGDVPGGKSQVLLWKGTFKLLHASGESLDLTFLATTQGGDKAAFIASTGLDRTAWLRVLALAGSSEDDPDHDENNRHQQHEPTTQQQAAQQAARAAESATAHERARAAAAAALKVLVEKLRDPKSNTRALVDPLREEASRLKPRLDGRQIDELAYELRGAFERVREAEAAEAALRAQEEATA